MHMATRVRLGADLRGSIWNRGATRLPIPGRSALDAARQVHSLLNTDHRRACLDAHLSGSFDALPHAETPRSRSPVERQRSARTTSDQDVAGISGRRDRHTLATSSNDPKIPWMKVRFLPAGRHDHRPLLSIRYMRLFILEASTTLGHQHRLQARILNYANDFGACMSQHGSILPCHAMWSIDAAVGNRIGDPITQYASAVAVPEESFVLVLPYTTRPAPIRRKTGMPTLGRARPRSRSSDSVERSAMSTSGRWTLKHSER